LSVRKRREEGKNKEPPKLRTSRTLNVMGSPTKSVKKIVISESSLPGRSKETGSTKIPQRVVKGREGLKVISDMP